MTMTQPEPEAPVGYVLACTLDELPERGKRTVHIGDTRVLIIVCDNQIYAVEDRCPQTGRSLAHGAVIDCAITVPTVGARYCLKSGRYLGGGQSPLQSHWLTTFLVRVEDQNIYIKTP